MAVDVYDQVKKAGDNLTGKDAKNVLERCEGRFQKAKDARMPFERQWYTNLAFYFGRQYAQWTPTIPGQPSRLYEPPAPPWRVRIVSNKIKPICRTEVAKITKQRPQAFVVPASSDDADLMAARAGETIFDNQWRELNLDVEIYNLSWWTVATGNGFLKSWWDPDKPDFDDKRGKICIENVTPFHLFVPDMAEPDLERQPYVIHAVMKDMDYVQHHYDQELDKKKLRKQDLTGGKTAIEQQFFTALGITAGNMMSEQVTVKEMWIKPCGDYKEGAVITWAGDQLLDFHEGWPYEHGEYPFSHVGHVPTGRFYRDSVIVDLIPLQKEYNRTRSQMIESKNRMSKPQLLAPKGSIVTSKVTSEPGLIIEYTPGFVPPSPLPLQDLPSYVKEELELCQRDMDDISSQHEITKGRTPPGVEAATAIAYLQEEDDSKLAATILSLEKAVEKTGGQILAYVNQFWTAQRTILVTGENGVWETYLLSKAELKGNSDLRIEASSAMPRSKAAKQAFITELIKMGVIDPVKGLKYLEMSETGKMYEESQVDSRQAQREHLRMAKMGEEIQPNTFDDHQIHVMEHNNYRKRQEYENLPDEIKQIFEAHVTAHQQAMMLQQGQMVSPDQAALGQPPFEQIEAGMEEGQPQIPGSEQVAQEPSNGQV